MIIHEKKNNKKHERNEMIFCFWLKKLCKFMSLISFRKIVFCSQVRTCWDWENKIKLNFSISDFAWLEYLSI